MNSSYDRSLTSDLIRAHLEHIKLEMGIGGYVLSFKKILSFEYTTDFWAKSLFKFIYKHNLIIEDQIPDLPLERIKDRYLMDIWSRQYDKVTLKFLNTCRMFLEVVSISEISDGEGTHIMQWAWSEIYNPLFISPHHWPKSEHPTEPYWERWREAILLIGSGSSLALHQTLGPWLENPKEGSWWLLKMRDKVCCKLKGGYKVCSMVWKINVYA